MVKFKNWVPAIAMMVIIFLISSTPGQTIEKVDLGKESYHVGGHFILFIILCFTYYKATKSVLLSILLTFIFGLTDELHQMYVPLRSASIKDIVVDTLGGSLTGLFLWKLQHLLPKKLKSWLIK